MSIANIIDGFFDDAFLHELHKTIMDVPMCAKNSARRSSWPYGERTEYRLFGYTLFLRRNLNRILILEKDYAQKFFDIFEALEEKILKHNFLIKEIFLNMQHTGCHGMTHTDGNDDTELTLMIMTNPVWEKDWGGEFQILDENEKVLETYDYIPGRIILFPAKVRHRGLGPIKEYIYRYTLVYRILP